MALPGQDCCAIEDWTDKATALMDEAPQGPPGRECCVHDYVTILNLLQPVATLHGSSSGTKAHDRSSFVKCNYCQPPTYVGSLDSLSPKALIYLEMYP